MQIYEAAARVTGASTTALTEGIRHFREKAAEAQKGNFELATSFGQIGIDVSKAVKDPGQAFSLFLDNLSKIPSAVERVQIAKNVLGETNEELLKSIVALTNNQGELKKQIEATGIAMSDQAVNDLAKLNQQYELFKLQVATLGEKTLVSAASAMRETTTQIDDISEAAKRGDIITAAFGTTVGRWFGEEQKAAGAVNDATAAVRGQIPVINNLAQSLENLNFQTLQTGVKKRVEDVVAQISSVAKRALTSKEAKAVFDQQLGADPIFKEAVEKSKIFEQNKKLFDDLLNPTPKADKSNIAAQRTETNDTLALLRVREQASEREAQAEIAAARRAFEDRKITIEQLVFLVTEAEKKMLIAKQATFAAERQEIEQSKLRATEKTVKLEQLGEREKAAQQKADQAIASVTSERARIEDQIFERSLQARLQRQDAASRAEIERVRAAANERTITEEAAERRVSQIQRETFDRREKDLIVQLTFLKAGSAEFQQVQDELAKLLQELRISVQGEHRFRRNVNGHFGPR